MEEEKSLKINQESMDVLVANVIPTTKYFESRFDHMQYQIDQIKKSQENMQKNIDKRFDDMQKDIDKRFDAVDKRFEAVDKRFEKVEHNIEELTKSINNLTLRVEQLAKTQETTIRDYIIERDRHYDMKFNNLRMFNIATITIVSGILLKMMGIINI
jgi:archaellum component FlaC